MKHVLPLLVAAAMAAIASDLGGSSTAMVIMLGLLGSIAGWYLGKRLWRWINE